MKVYGSSWSIWIGFWVAAKKRLKATAIYFTAMAKTYINRHNSTVCDTHISINGRWTRNIPPEQVNILLYRFTISKIEFWQCKSHLCPLPASCPLPNFGKINTVTNAEKVMNENEYLHSFRYVSKSHILPHPRISVEDIILTCQIHLLQCEKRDFRSQIYYIRKDSWVEMKH